MSKMMGTLIPKKYMEKEPPRNNPQRQESTDHHPKEIETKIFGKLDLEKVEDRFVAKNAGFFELLDSLEDNECELLVDLRQSNWANWYSLIEIHGGGKTHAMPLPVFLSIVNSSEFNESFDRKLEAIMDKAGAKKEGEYPEYPYMGDVDLSEDLETVLRKFNLKAKFVK